MITLVLLVSDSGDIQAAPADIEMRDETADNAYNEVNADEEDRTTF